MSSINCLDDKGNVSCDKALDDSLIIKVKDNNEKTTKNKTGQKEFENKFESNKNSNEDNNVIVLDWKEEVKVLYKVEETPPLCACLLLAFQHYLSMCIATLTIPILLSPALCIYNDNLAKSEITGTLFVASGIITLFQTFLGVRLPIVQAGTFALLVPTLSYLSLPQFTCPPVVSSGNISINDTSIFLGSPQHRQVWMGRLREIQGCILIAASFQVILGFSGLVGFVTSFIGPLTICPTVTLLGLSLFKNASSMASKHWLISLLSILMMIIFSQCLNNVKIPCLLLDRKRGCHKQYFLLFKMFPIVLAITISWFVCYILTITNAIPNNKSSYGYEARTDLRTSAIDAAPWFRVPYPMQWGIPTFSISGVIALLSGIIATTIESVGDYYSCAKLSGAPPPPSHAINRGIFIEGLGSMLDGLFGTGNGTTSTSINVGVIGITKVGSRRVVQVSAMLMILFGLFTKTGALFLSIPDPIIGGIFFILFGLIVAVGLSTLQNLNQNNSRNMFIVGFSLLMGLAIPEWIGLNTQAIDTGNKTFDNTLIVLLKTNMFVGGCLGFFLDNIIPGSRKTRGLELWDKLKIQNNKSSNSYFEKRISATYDLPNIFSFFNKINFFSYFPLCPSYRGYCWSLNKKQNKFLDKYYKTFKNNCLFKICKQLCSDENEDEREEELVSHSENGSDVFLKLDKKKKINLDDLNILSEIPSLNKSSKGSSFVLQGDQGGSNNLEDNILIKKPLNNFVNPSSSTLTSQIDERISLEITKM